MSCVAKTNLLKLQTSVYIRYLPIVMHALHIYVLSSQLDMMLSVIQALCVSARVVVMSLVWSQEHAWKCLSTLCLHDTQTR